MPSSRLKCGKKLRNTSPSRFVSTALHNLVIVTGKIRMYVNFECLFWPIKSIHSKPGFWTRYFENDSFMGRKWAPGYGACARKKICHCGKQMDWECRENNWRPVSNFVITPWPFYNFFVERVENSASRFVVSIPDCLFRLPQTGELDKNKVSLLQFVQLFLILRRALFRWLLWKEENVMTSTFLTPSSL